MHFAFERALFLEEARGPPGDRIQQSRPPYRSLDRYSQ
ncbi:hypothetical protein B0G57_10750 [Trinickia symbiotica]|nr:hypothetical protein B0G57_10750 [Trinickia symbiotica]